MRREIAIRATRCFATTLLTAFAVGLFASAAQAEEDMRYHDLTTNVSTLELGTLFSSDDDFKFGDFTGLGQGLEADGWSILGNVDLHRRSASDAAYPYYLRVRGLNLGLDSRYADAEVKLPILFGSNGPPVALGVSLFYDEIPKYQTDSAQTFFSGAGTGSLTLPSGWTASAADFDNFLYVNEIDHKRRTAGIETSVALPSHFDFDASYQQQKKRGEKLIGSMIGRSWGNAGSQIVPEPLEYTTHQIDSHLRYTADDFQLQLQYYASGFYNRLHELAWQDPRNNLPIGNGLGFDDGSLGQKASMPDNWFHQVTASGGLNLPANSRIMLNAAFGWGTQRDDFLPYHVNPLLIPTLGLPRSNLDGKLETRLVTFRFASNPLPKLGVNVGYRWNQRDNDSPINTYSYVRADSEGENFAIDRVNRPYSFEQHKVDADVSYRFFKRTKLTVMYEWERMNRNLQEVEENDEHSVGAKLVSRPNHYVSLGARYERSYRNGSYYDCVKPYIAGRPTVIPPGGVVDPECPGTAETNSPQLRKYYMANRHRYDTHAWLTVTPLDNLSIGSHLKFIDDDYYKSKFGLTGYRLLSTGVDFSYMATDALNFHAFYNFDESKREMGSTTSPTSFDPDDDWSSKDEDTTNSVGAGIDFDAIPDRLSVGFEYLFARSVGRVDTTTVAGPVSPPFPNNETELHDVSVQGKLQLTRNLSMRVGYLWEDFNSDDWATEDVCPTCLRSGTAVIASGESPPDYRAHVVSMSLIYRFW
jgi:MtrB/PioB family decaheme-associated outer membrane protein